MNALDKFATKQRLKKAFMDKTANPANVESLKMNALERYVTKTKLAHALREKIASPKKSLTIPPIRVSEQKPAPVREVSRSPKIPPASMATFVKRPIKEEKPAMPGLKWTGKRTPTKVKVLGGPKNRPLVARSGGQLIYEKTNKPKPVTRMMATGH